jgi:uncharacterized membrane protein YjjB (DUF3815 family)
MVFHVSFRQFHFCDVIAAIDHCWRILLISSDQVVAAVIATVVSSCSGGERGR